MSAITVIGGTGYAGAAIVAEAARRGHAVTSVSRSEPSDPVDGVAYAQGSILDADIVARAIDGADVVVLATSARGDMSDSHLKASQGVADAAAAAGAWLVVVGGYSSLRPAPGEPRFIEAGVAEQYRVEAEAGHSVLEWLLEQEAAGGAPDWTFVSPAAKFGSWVPGEATGAYRIGGDVALRGEDGSSFVSSADFASAILDVIEGDKHRRQHISVVG